MIIKLIKELKQLLNIKSKALKFIELKNNTNLIYF